MQFDRLRRREFITLLGSVATWPLAARAQQASSLHLGDMVITHVRKIKQSRLQVKLTALDRAIGELAKLEQRRLETLQEEHLLRGQLGVEAIGITAKKVGLTRNLVRRSMVIEAALVETAKAEAKRLGLDSSQTALYRAARSPTRTVRPKRSASLLRVGGMHRHTVWDWVIDGLINKSLSYP